MEKKIGFVISSKGMIKTMEANGLLLQMPEPNKAIVLKGTEKIFEETVPIEELKIDTNSKVYKSYPDLITKTHLIKYVFHKLLLGGFISMYLPDNIDVYEVTMIQK